MKRQPTTDLVQQLVRSGIFDAIGDGISIQDTDFEILYQNSKHMMLVGNHVGEYCYSAYEKRTAVCQGCPLAMSFADGLPHTEERTAPTDRGTLHVEITASVLRDETGQIIAGIEVVRDITDRKRMEAELRANALTDDLTGLLNRRGFFALAEQQCKLATRNGSTLALAFLDLDDLKTINDELGHDAGDQALVALAGVFRQTFREADIVARIGGDEFAVLLTELPEESMSEVIVEHLHRNLEHFNRQSDRRHPLAVSCGIAHFDPQRPSTVDAMLSRADQLMYQEKKHK